MREKIIIASLLLLVGGIIGYNLNRPAPPPDITYITQIKKVADVAQKKAERKKREYTEIKPTFDSAAKNLQITDTAEVKRFQEIAKETDRKCKDALDACHLAVAAKNDVIVKYDTLVQKIKPQQKRFRLSAEALWNFTDSIPVIRADVGIRVKGNWWVKVEGQKIPTLTKTPVLLVGLKYQL